MITMPHPPAKPVRQTEWRTISFPGRRISWRGQRPADTWSEWWMPLRWRCVGKLWRGLVKLLPGAGSIQIRFPNLSGWYGKFLLIVHRIFPGWVKRFPNGKQALRKRKSLKPIRIWWKKGLIRMWRKKLPRIYNLLCCSWFRFNFSYRILKSAAKVQNTKVKKSIIESKIAFILL